ncbi:MAG: AAA family ATPase [Planctomycetota bacterium]|jgi:flagellar biosynthesis protein FlhG|nr:AAA family ATPase [Planctomycetota bacterium]MDP6761828.1 AAA family ATPase [Planctomycetota bacterium]MDP6988874.1 AAA family ATPase [Planctomycetota bacterium]
MLNVSRFDFGQIRALRRFIDADRRMRERTDQAARVVCIASGKGGTGKSVVATNLAVLRARRGERVLLVDFDSGLANAHLLLGLAPAHDLGDVLDGSVRARDALVEGPEGVHLLSGGVGQPALCNPTRRELDRLYRALEPLESDFDLIIVDHGAGMGYATVTQLAATSAMLLVANPEVTSLSDAYAIYKRALGVNEGIRAGLIINRAPDERSALGAREKFDAVSQRFLKSRPEFVGWVPQDDAVGRSVNLREPACLSQPHAPASRALTALADWDGLSCARTATAFYRRARRALR